MLACDAKTPQFFDIERCELLANRTLAAVWPGRAMRATKFRCFSEKVFCESGESVRFPWEGADLRGSPGNLQGSLGNIRGTSGLLLISTARELPEKSPDNFWGSPGTFQKLGGEPDSQRLAESCLQVFRELSSNSAVPKRGHPRRGRMQKSAQKSAKRKSAKERKRKSAKERKRAQKNAKERFRINNSLKQPGLRNSHIRLFSGCFSLSPWRVSPLDPATQCLQDEMKLPTPWSHPLKHTWANRPLGARSR